MTENYPEELPAMVAWSKMPRLYTEKMNAREKAIEAFWKAYHHPLSNDAFRMALQQQQRRLGILTKEPAVANSVLPPVSQPPASRLSTGTTGGLVLDDLPMLPFTSFDASSHQASFDQTCSVVPVEVEKIALKGVVLKNQNQLKALLPWKKIKILSAGKIPGVRSMSAGMEKDFLLVDLVVSCEGRWIIYRVSSNRLDFPRLFPRVEQTFSEGFQNLIGIILNNSGAICHPDKERCLGPSFVHYPDLQNYEAALRTRWQANL